MNADMKRVSEYFSELHEAGDPAKVLRVIRNFLSVFGTAVDDIKVCGMPQTLQASSRVC